MFTKLLPKIKTYSACFGIALVLVIASLSPLVLVTPKTTYADSTLPAYRYTKTFDTSASGAYATASDVVTDSHGNVYLIGYFKGTVVFDGVGGSDSQTSANVSSFFTKYNANGTYAWTKTFDTTAGGASAWAYDMAVDSQGDIYMSGTFQDTVVFDGVGGSDSQTAPSSNDGFITKYNANGSYGWTKVLDATNGSVGDYGGGNAATDSSGNVYITGYFSGTVVFDGVGGSDSQTSANGSAFLTKYNANGSYGWTKIFDTSASGGWAFGGGVVIDQSNNIFFSGAFQGTVIFDGVGGSDSQTDYGTHDDTFLTKYNANGSYGWTKTFDATNGSANENGPGDVAVDAQGNIYVTGDSEGTVVFDGVGGSDSQTSANGSAFLTKYNANGSYGWTKIFGTTNGSATANNVAISSQGDVYLTGYFTGTVVFNGTGGSDSQTANGGNTDNFLTKYNADGSYSWTKSFDVTNGSTNQFNLGSVSTDLFGNVYFTGDFSGTVIFDGVGGTDSQTSANGSSFLTSFQASTYPGPNSGDGNNDGTPDYLQPYISTVNDSVTNNYVVVQTPSSCTINAASVAPSSANSIQDSGYAYPAGLVNFTTNCGTPGFTANVTMYFYGVSANSNLILRKYNSTNHTYMTIPNATISQITIAGQTVTKVTYQVTDGGPLDQDGTANGVIVDPVGLADPVPAAPNTGLGLTANHLPIALSLIGLSSIGLVLIASRHSKLMGRR